MRRPVRMLVTLVLPLLARLRLEVRALVRFTPVGLPAEQREGDEQAKPQPRGRAEAAVAAELPEMSKGRGDAPAPHPQNLRLALSSQRRGDCGIIVVPVRS
jgi:hypothetical protein